jgi:DegV family protein with EDD domain
MSKIKIFTDSAADLPKEMLERYDIGVVPILISFPDRTYADGQDLSASEFYQLLGDSPQLPVTSQPSPHDFVEAFTPVLQAGGQVISICLSSGLSGTLESALLAKESLGALGKELYVVDSLSASLGQGVLVLLAADLAEQGKTPEEIVQAVTSARQRLMHMFTLETTENLVKGGRISRTKGTLGDLLNIKPILHLDDAGRIDMLDKVRGRKKSLRYLVDSFRQEAKSLGYPYLGISHADCLEEAREVAKQMQQLFPDIPVVMGTIGATVGTHTAKGCIAIFYFR